MKRALVPIILCWVFLAAGNSRPVKLVWYATGPDEKPLDAKDADKSINPASVTKVATTLWALDRLGPEFRFETRVGFRGDFDRARGVLHGDLLVFGGGDPDFHVENAWILARELNRAGLREVHGDLLVSENFWIGWEGGASGRDKDAYARTRRMARRLRDALDPQRWSKQTREGILEFLLRRNQGETSHPSIVVHGSSGGHVQIEAPSEQILLTYRSNPLVQILKRFNSFSNNDMERLEVQLGSPSDLAHFLTERWAIPDQSIRFETLSGLGRNRMTSRQIVRLLRDLRKVCQEHELEVHDVLPRAGCDPGTLKHFPLLSSENEIPLVAKTGTLTQTDGGIAVLAGFVDSGEGNLVFSVAAPGMGHRLQAARLAQQQWLLGLLETIQRTAPLDCGAAVVYSDHDVQLIGTP